MSMDRPTDRIRDDSDDSSVADTSGWERRAQNVFVRSQSEVCHAMSWQKRFKKKVKAKFDWWVRPSTTVAGETVNGESEVRFGDGAQGPRHTPIQYRLEATRRVLRSKLSHKLTACFRCQSPASPVGSRMITGVGVTPNQKLAMYLHWMFQVNFVFLFAVMCVMFFVLCFVFAGLIISAGRLDDECHRIGGEPFGHASSDFADAFALSWTTFSTVGYGSTYPVVCSMESFLGVLYSGFCGAILFGKVLRIQSHAQVVFSDPIVIRYGPGIDQHGEDDSDESDEEDDIEIGPNTPKKKKIPCPVLEFRVVNRLFNEIGGELMDATLNVSANIDADDVDPKLRNELQSTRQRYVRSRQHSTPSESTSDTHSETGATTASFASSVSDTTSFFGRRLTIGDLLHPHRKAIAVDEDPTSRLVSKRIFAKMIIEQQEHPFFKRVWLAQHVLDENSPILKPRVRRQIRRNNGHWPERLNTYTGVRSSLQFNQILVSLNGVCNVSASDVYAQKIYDLVDVNIGYQFVNILYRDTTDGSLMVDTDLINDVRQQKGGGGEPLIFGD